jgi:hypothetical protein
MRMSVAPVDALPGEKPAQAGEGTGMGLSDAVSSDQSFDALDCQIVLGSRGWKRGDSFLACPLRLQRHQPIEQS